MVSNNRALRIISALAGLVAGFALVGVAAAEDGQPLKVEYIRPGTDFSAYRMLLINDLDIANTKIVPPPWKADRPFDWEVTEANNDALQAAFHAAMRENISDNDGYPIVAESGQGVMEITVRIISFMPYAERDEEVLTRGSGEMRIYAELRDSQSRKLLAIFEGPQEVGEEYKANSDFSRLENLKGLFNSWGRRIRTALDGGHARN